MGRIAFEAAGVAAGLATAYFTGNPFLGMAVYTAAETVGNTVLFPPQSETFGPRIQDTQIAVPTYGTARPFGYGRVRVPGRMIWCLGNRLQERVSRQGSGVKGGEGTTTYSYSLTAAFSLIEGPAVSVTRIWGDGKLFYSWDGVNPSSVKEKYPGVVRIYLGDGVQGADPTIQAGQATISGYTMVAGGSQYAVGDTGGVGGGHNDLGYKVLTIGGGGAITSVQLFGGTGYSVGPTYPLHRGGSQEGRGNGASLTITSIASGTTKTPAYLTDCYLVLNGLPLADFANHPPLITAEVNRTASPIVLSSIVQDICLRAGLTSGQIDASALTQEVLGYTVTNRPSARGALQPLQDIYLFDPVETDDQIVFVPRGQSSLMTIDASCLGAHEPQEPVPPVAPLTHIQEVEVPERVELTYMDLNRDYQQAMQYATRARAPQPTQFSRQRRRIQAPIVMSADAAKQQALKMLYGAWIERDQKAISSSRALSRLDPGDVITVQDGERTHTLRLTQSDLGAQGLLKWQAVTEQASVFSIATPGNQMHTSTQFLIVPTATTLLVLDTSILAALDDDTGLYFAAASTDLDWRGAALWRSLDGTSDWQAVATFQAVARYGTAATALDDWVGYNTWDTANTVDVIMTVGTLDSYTESEVLAGRARAALLGDEILFWQNATEIDPDTHTWRLDTLLRGRRGTDWAMGDHAEDEAFIVLDPDAIKRYAAPPSDINHTRFYKLVTNGQAFDDAAVVEVVNEARGQQCFTPGHIRGARNTSNDVTATWRPRTRIPWTRIAGVSGPLGEREERYTVSSILGLGSPIVLRTWTLTDRTVTYLASEQSSDGLTPGDPVYLRVQMMNEYTGAGHAKEAAV